jgi:hypothetical protein
MPARSAALRHGWMTELLAASHNPKPVEIRLRQPLPAPWPIASKGWLIGKTGGY